MKIRNRKTNHEALTKTICNSSKQSLTAYIVSRTEMPRFVWSHSFYHSSSGNSRAIAEPKTVGL